MVDGDVSCEEITEFGLRLGVTIVDAYLGTAA